MKALLCRRPVLPLVFCCVFSFSLSAATHTLTINTNGNGTVSRNPTNSVYPSDATVTLSAVSGVGWQFASWSGDATDNVNPLNVTMDADKIITANFAQIPTYTLTVN